MLWTSAAVPGIWNRVCIDSLAVFILRRIYRREGKWWYALLFVYPFLSYFSYFGFFLLAYLVCAVVIVSIRDKKFCGRLAVAVPVLAAGYVCFEYRLFGQMLFSDVKTIRETMVESNFELFRGTRSDQGSVFDAGVPCGFRPCSFRAAGVRNCIVWQLVAAVRRKI